MDRDKVGKPTYRYVLQSKREGVIRDGDVVGVPAEVLDEEVKEMVGDWIQEQSAGFDFDTKALVEFLRPCGAYCEIVAAS